MGPENRAFLLTGPGSAGIAVIRVAGPSVTDFLARHFSKPPKAARPVHGQFRDGEETIDDPVVVLGEDGRTADINLHGGPWIVQRVLEICASAGFAIAAPTIPVPLDAVDGDTIIDREVAAWLPAARTPLAVRALLNQPRLWREALSHPDPAVVDRCLADRGLHWLLHPPRVAIVGIPNVGKSTLANQLFAQERSITADMPGTTRDWVGEIANIDGLAVMLVDTPGMRESEDAIERSAILHGREQVRAADLVIVVVDPTQGKGDQRGLLGEFSNALVVINKSDRPPTWDAGIPGALQTVATTGAGVDKLRSAIRQHFLCDDGVADRPACWTDRQRLVLRAGAGCPDR